MTFISFQNPIFTVNVKLDVTPVYERIRNSAADVPETDSGFSPLGAVFSRYPKL